MTEVVMPQEDVKKQSGGASSPLLEAFATEEGKKQTAENQKVLGELMMLNAKMKVDLQNDEANERNLARLKQEGSGQ